jgi:Zn finger protein HypA/HybF involved in hydrogenase expression
MPHSSPYPYEETSSPVEDDQEDFESDEFYCTCHACEEESDPLLPVYYCDECDFYCYMSGSVSCVF